MLKEYKIISLLLIFFIQGCSIIASNSQHSRLNLLTELSSSRDSNPDLIHALSKETVAEGDWKAAFLGYQWLCNNKNNIEQHCLLMWHIARKSIDKALLFSASATYYAVTKNIHWLDTAKKYGKTARELAIIDILSNRPLTQQQLSSLSQHSSYYAQAIFIKGKHSKNIELIHKAINAFVKQELWQLAADASVFAAHFSLNNQRLDQAERFFNDALLYYDLTDRKDKSARLIEWGHVNGLLR